MNEIGPPSKVYRPHCDEMFPEATDRLAKWMYATAQWIDRRANELENAES